MSAELLPPWSCDDRRLVQRHDREYRRERRQGEWALVARAVRERDGACTVCGSGLRLQCAHLVSEYELFLLGVRARYGRDSRNLTTLCQSCHTAFDGFVGVTPVHGIPQRRAFERRWRRNAPGFRAVLMRRLRFVVVLIAEGAL